jgi:hypothetical protein
MAGKAVFCIVPDVGRASRLVGDLQAAGFSSNDISVLMPDKATTRDFAHKHATKAPEGAATGGAAGGVVGGALGLLVGIGSLAIPGAGPFIAAGPLMAMLGGAAVGGAIGGLTGALVGMGLPEYEAKRFEGKIQGGNILVSVHSDRPEETHRAKEVFERNGAEDIATAGEASVPKSRDDARGPKGAAETMY